MKTLNIPIAASLKARLDAHAKANGIHKKKVVELALDAFLQQAVLPVAKQVDGDMFANDPRTVHK